MIVVWNGTPYYYVTSFQGDVQLIMNLAGEIVVSYVYDAWGNIVDADGSLATTLGALNPLRYRGYVYDTETGLYYLQSRYYNPEWGRFINAYSQLNPQDGLLGFNMFAYCNNNPINGCDPSGTSYICNYTGSEDFFFATLMHIGFGGGGGGSAGSFGNGTAAADFIKKVRDIVGNTSEQKVQEDLASKGIAFYKGVPVLSADWMGSAALSFGIIIIGRDRVPSPSFADTLNHEYGHVIHFAMVGPIDYFTTTAIPSLVGAAISGNGSSFQRFVRDNYYNLPWERTADYFGGVNRGYAPYANTSGSLFWIYTLIVSAGTP